MTKSVPVKRWTPPRVPLVLLCLFVIACNVVDALATLHACATMGAEEMNPLMAKLLEYGPGTFLAFKSVGVGLMIVGLALAMHHRKTRDGFRKGAFGGLIMLSVVYGALAVWHALTLSGSIPLPSIDAKPAHPACHQK